jgi:anthranilate phosphoribosyltransferase
MEINTETAPIWAEAFADTINQTRFGGLLSDSARFGLSFEAQAHILQTIQGTVPLLKSSRFPQTYTYACLPHAQWDNQIGCLAANLVLAGVGLPMVLVGDYGYDGYIGSSDVLEYIGLGFAQNGEQLGVQTDKFRFGYVHASAYYPPLQKLKRSRQELSQLNPLDRLIPLLSAYAQTEKILLADTLPAFENVRKWASPENASLQVLYDRSDWGLMSFRYDFYTYWKGTQEKNRLQDWNLPVLTAYTIDTENTQTIAEEAEHLQNLLNGTAPEAEQNLLLHTVAYLLWRWGRVSNFEIGLMEAEACLLSKRAAQLLDKLVKN